MLVSHDKSFYIDCGSKVAANSWIDEIERMVGDLEGKIITKQSRRGGAKAASVASCLMCSIHSNPF